MYNWNPTHPAPFSLNHPQDLSNECPLHPQHLFNNETRWLVSPPSIYYCYKTHYVVIKLTNNHQNWITTIPPIHIWEVRRTALRSLASVVRLQPYLLPRSDHCWLAEYLVTASWESSLNTSGQRRNDQTVKTKETPIATLQMLCVSRPLIFLSVLEDIKDL